MRKPLLIASVAVLFSVIIFTGCANDSDSATNAEKVPTVNTVDPKAIYSEKTNGIENSKLVEIAREFIKSNPREIYRTDKKLTDESYESYGRDMLEYALNNDPVGIRFKEAHELASDYFKTNNRYVIFWEICWGNPSKDGRCENVNKSIFVTINKDLEAEKSYVQVCL